MSEMIQIKIDTFEFEEKVKILRHIKDGAPKAVMRTLNRVAAGMNTDASREVPRMYHVKAAEVKKKLAMSLANQSNLSITMRSTGRPIRLYHFKTKRNKRPGQKGAPTAFAQVLRSSGGGRLRNPSAFMMPYKTSDGGGHEGIFVRTGKKRVMESGTYAGKEREAVEQKYGPGSVQMLDNPEIREIIQKRAVERFNERLDHEIKFLLDKSNNA